MTDCSVSPIPFAPDADWPAWPSASVIERAAVHVVRVDLAAEHRHAAADRAILSRDEVSRADRFVIEAVRERFIACRGALRRMLAQALECDPRDVGFEYGPHGKPRLCRNTAPAFNVAHSHAVALIALSWAGEIGVDVEAMEERGWATLARRFFAAEEWEQLQSLPRELQRAGFYRVWTGKEAYLKATGRGMTLPLGSFVMCADPRLPPRVVHVNGQPAEAERWRAWSVAPLQTFPATLMCASAVTQVRQWTWTT